MEAVCLAPANRQRGVSNGAIAGTICRPSLEDISKTFPGAIEGSFSAGFINPIADREVFEMRCRKAAVSVSTLGPQDLP